MMLTRFKKPPEPVSTSRPRGKKKKEAEPEEDGTRKDASDFFAALDVQAALLNATVLLTGPEGTGSGVIVGVDDNKAYILTAKHNLFILAGTLTPIDKRTRDPKKPSDYTLTDYGTPGIKITYGPTELLKAPEQAAVQVSGFNFANVAGSGDSWTYDAMLFECTNTAFRTFVTNNRFIRKANYARNSTVLGLRNKGGSYALLDRRLKHIQLGYGKARDDNMDMNRDNYRSFEGKIQCKPSLPTFGTTAPGILFEPSSRDRDRSKWRSMSDAIELDASVTSSTAPGDSGGPLFAIKTSDTAPTEIYLMGVNSGANFYSDERKLANPPGDRTIHNNVVTYWHEIFKYCAFLDRE